MNIKKKVNEFFSRCRSAKEDAVYSFCILDLITFELCRNMILLNNEGKMFHWSCLMKYWLTGK